MSDDPRIHWTLANAYGIWKRGNNDTWFLGREPSPSDIWNSGRATDVLIRPDGNLVVASDNGGIWLVPDTTSGGTFCVSDQWEDAAFKSLELGTRGDDHVFAGGDSGALYVTDMSTSVPLLNWTKLKSLVRDAPGTGTIRDIVVLRGSQVIVLACDGGIFWSRITPAPGDPLHWKQANVVGSVSGGFYSLAEGPPLPGPQAHPNAPIVETLMVGGMGLGTTTGFFVGQWDPADNLTFRQAHLFNLSSDVTLFSSAMTFAVVTSFPLDRNLGYAACVVSYSDELFAVFKTADGGRTWHALDTKMLGFDAKKTFADAFGTSQGGHNLCIEVSNSDPDIVTLGLRNGAISFDGGHTWTKPGFDTTQSTGIVPHIHADLTNYAFGRTTTTENLPPSSYYVASDGGVAQVRWGDGAWVIESDVTEGDYQGNLYAVVLDGNNLVLHVRHSGGPDRISWEPEQVITSKATGSGCLIQSSFAGGDSGNRNLEVIVLEGNELVHYWCAIQKGKYTNWNRGAVITTFATGPGCLIQSTMGTGSDGNFEVVALEGSDLVHDWRDNGAPGFPWHRAATISTMASAAGCLIQSNYSSGENGQGCSTLSSSAVSR